jgi:hypothetical protein
VRAHLEDETLDGGCRGVSLRPAFGTNETLGRLQIMTVPKGRE